MMEKYDKNYRRDFLPAIVGLILIGFNYYLYSTKVLTSENISYYLVFSLIVRIWLSIWVHFISLKLNSQGYWGILCFVFPELALIWISFIKKTRKGFYELEKIHKSLHEPFENEVILIEKPFQNNLLTRKEFHRAFKTITRKYIELTEGIVQGEKENRKIDQVKQLEILRERGILTNEEFKIKAKKLQ